MVPKRLPKWIELRSQVALHPPPMRLANHILQTSRIAQPPVDVEGIIEGLGIPVKRISNPGWSGASKHREFDAAIWINADEPDERQRFTLAHSLGHVLLHPGLKGFTEAAFADGPEDTEANKFAAALLMPMWMLEEFAHHRGATVEALASLFRVPAHVMQVRMAEMYGNPVKW